MANAQATVTRSVEWATFNKPAYIHAGPLTATDGSRFWYGPDRARAVHTRFRVLLPVCKLSEWRR